MVESAVGFNNELYFNEAGPRHRFLKFSGGVFVNTYSPHYGDIGLSCLCVGSDRLWAVSKPSFLLCQFAKGWSGYVHETNGQAKKIWNIVGDLARASDQYCFDKLDCLYLVNRDTATPTGALPNVLSVMKRKLLPYKRVRFSYANGMVDAGTGQPVLDLDCPYVYDKGHAEILCDAGYDFYASAKRIFYVECAGIIEQFGLAEEKTFTYQGKGYAGIIIGRELRNDGTTLFALLETVVTAEAV